MMITALMSRRVRPLHACRVGRKNMGCVREKAMVESKTTRGDDAGRALMKEAVCEEQAEGTERKEWTGQDSFRVR